MEASQLDALKPFEMDLFEALGAVIREDERAAAAVYGALSNVEWERADGGRDSITWRGANQLVSAIRGQGDHDLAFYLSGNEGTVTPFVADALAPYGWRAVE